MELILNEGAYLPDGAGGFLQAEGTEAVLQRALFRLTVRRGTFPMMPELGSRLYLLGNEKPSSRLAAAYQYAVEALEDESGLRVEAVTLEEEENGHFSMQVQLAWQGERYSLPLQI